MSKYLTLTKILLKTGGDAVFKIGTANNKKGSQVKKLLLIGLILLSFLPLAALIGRVVMVAYEPLENMGQEGVLLAVGLSITSTVIFVFGIFYVMNVFYYSRDIENLLPLPLRPSEILGAKFTVTIFYEYLTELMFLVPILVGFGIKSGAGFLYYLYSFILFLTMPIAPLVYASALSMVVMRFTSIAKNKDRFGIVGGMIVMFIAIGINIFIQRLAVSTTDPAKIQQIFMQGNNSALKLVSYTFPGNRFGAEALINSGNGAGALSMLVFLAIMAVFIGVFLYLGEKLYFKGVIGITQVASKRKALSKEEYNKSVVQSSALRTFMMKELRLLFRTPIYFVNCVIVNFLLPIFLLLPFLAQPKEMEDLYRLVDTIQTGNIAHIILAAAFGISLFVSSTNAIASTAISREGRNLFVNKYLPMSYKEQLMAKVYSGVILSGVGSMMLILTALILFKMPLYLLALIAFVSVVAVFFSAFIGILIDLNYPKLQWDSEQKAVKQNVNVLLHMLAVVVLGGLAVVPIFVFGMNVWVAFAWLVGGFGILNGVLYWVMSTVGVKLLAKIEI